MEFRILGPLEVIGHEGIPLPLPRGRGRALLAVLILHAGQVVSSDRLIDDLWGEDQPATATTALQGLVLGLRKRLEPLRSKGVAPSILQTRSPGYLLAIDDDQVDALRFRRLLKEAAGSTVPERTAILQAALGLWRGPALTDFTYQPFAQMEITALDELRITAVEERIDADLTSGRHGGLVSELESLVAEYPLREGLQGQLMLALYRAGRQAEALDLYRNLRQTLVEELGVEPGPALQALEGAILRQDPSLDPPLPETPGRTGLAAQMSDAHDSPWLPPGRKTVTVVFADLAPIDIDGEIDPEARRMITRRGYDIAASAFTRHGGTVEGLIGDVVVAVFGVPVAHEDDALRGVRAALEFQEQLRELNERLDSGLGSKLAARVGIATGEVVVGGPGIGGPSTSGGTVNIAARLQQTAATEEVLVGEATRRLVEDVARVESVGLIASGLPAWRVTGLVAHSAAVVRDAETLIVGRDAELAQLGTLFDEMVRSRRAVLVRVLGEAGIGKSRLVREFATPVARQALVLTGHCPAYGKEITFWSLREIVLQALDTTGANSIADLMTSGDAVPIAAQLAGAIGLTEEPVRRQGLFQAFRRLLEELARKQPVVVIFEDVHWAQSTLLDLVDYLADSIHEPTMLVCVARPELLDRHRAWTGPGSSLLVGPLGPGDSEKLLADRISDRTLSKDLASQVLEAAQGNPLFVEQLAAALHDDGTLAIPATVDALLSARLDSLGPAERDLLRCASVVGMEFSAEVLRALVPAEARPFVVRHLEALRDKELIASTDRRFLASPAWTFRHTLIQLAAYRSTTRQARSELHERFAGWLESEKPPGSVGYDEILGHHLEQAFLDRRHLGLSDDHTKSLAVAAGERLAEAGLRALAKFDAAAAESLLARAMALIPSTHPSRSEVGSRMAEAYTIMGHHRDADAVLAELQKTLVPGDNKTGRFIRIERAGILLATGPDPVSLEAIRHEASQVLAASEQARDEEGIAHSLFVLAVVHFRAGEFGAMEKLARRNIAHADRSGIAREELGARLVLALALESGPVPVSEAIRELELVVRWRNTEHPSLLSTLAHLRAMIGEFDQARELIFRSRRLLMEQTPARRPLGLLSEHGAAVEITAGDLVAAERHLREGLELNLSMGERERVALVAAILSGILAGRADHREVMRMASLSRDQAPSESVVAQARWRAAMARAMANHHDSKEAEQFARQALDLVTADMLNLAAEFRLNLAEILMKGPRDDEIRRLIDEAVVLYKRKGNLVGAARARSLDPWQAVHE